MMEDNNIDITETDINTTEPKSFLERMNSTDSDEPTHKNILGGIYDLSDFIKSYITPMQIEISKLEKSMSELNGKFNILIGIGFAIIGFLLYSYFYSIMPLNVAIENIKTSQAKENKLNDERMDNFKEQLLDLKKQNDSIINILLKSN